jgi:hypothetical protein
MLLNANVHIIDEGCSYPPQEKKKKFPMQVQMPSFEIHTKKPKQPN